MFHTSLLTEHNDLAVFDYSTRKTCTDTCNVKRLGRPEFHFAIQYIHS